MRVHYILFLATSSIDNLYVRCLQDSRFIPMESSRSYLHENFWISNSPSDISVVCFKMTHKYYMTNQEKCLMFRISNTGY